jgi:hypothetical protein
MVKLTKMQTRSFGAWKKAASGSIGAFNKLKSVVKNGPRHITSGEWGALAQDAAGIAAGVADARHALSGMSMGSK